MSQVIIAFKTNFGKSVPFIQSLKLNFFFEYFERHIFK